MRKLLFLMFAVVMALTATAQTNFRHISFAEAQKAAQQEKKLIFVDFYTSWCGPCKNMANNVFPQKSVGDFMNEKFVCVKYDAEKEELDLVKRSNITAYPTFVIYNADGTEVNRKVGGASAEAFVADMDRLSNADLTPEKIRTRWSSGERSAQLVKAYASMLIEEASNSRKARAEKMEEANTIVNEYFNSLNDKQKLNPENYFLYKEYCDKISDVKMQYLYNNRDKVAKANRNDVDSILIKEYTKEIHKMVAFYEPFSKEDYSLLREQSKAFKELNTPMLEGCMEVLDAYASGDMNKYVDKVAENAEGKCKENSFSLFYGMGDALDNADKDVKMRAAKIIREQLMTMPGNNISFIGTVISSLEGTRSRH